MIAPVGAYESPFSVSALRSSTDRHGWSGKSPWESHSRQYSEVRSIRSNASWKFFGPSCSDHDSDTNAVSPLRSVVRAAARGPSKPIRRSVCSSSSTLASRPAARASWYVLPV
jgi:hypothetical protein